MAYLPHTVQQAMGPKMLMRWLVPHLVEGNHAGAAAAAPLVSVAPTAAWSAAPPPCPGDAEEEPGEGDVAAAETKEVE